MDVLRQDALAGLLRDGLRARGVQKVGLAHHAAIRPRFHHSKACWYGMAPTPSYHVILSIKVGLATTPRSMSGLLRSQLDTNPSYAMCTHYEIVIL